MKFIFPTYKDAALNIPVRKEDFSTHSQEVKRAVTEQGETYIWKDTIMQLMHFEIDDIDSFECTGSRIQPHHPRNLPDHFRSKEVSGHQWCCIVSKYETRMQNLDKCLLNLKLHSIISSIVSLTGKTYWKDQIHVTNIHWNTRTRPCHQQGRGPLPRILPIDKCWMSHLSLEMYILTFLNYLVWPVLMMKLSGHMAMIALCDDSIMKMYISRVLYRRQFKYHQKSSLKI